MLVFLNRPDQFNLSAGFIQGEAAKQQCWVVLLNPGRLELYRGKL
jgi:hypothetical protein